MIGLMFSGGASLEAIASRRARRELTALVQRAPKVAQLRIDDRLEEVAVERVQAGDIVLVRAGEVVPVDGTVRQSRGRRRHEHAQRRAAARDPETGHVGAQRVGQRGGTVRRPGRPARPADSAYAALVRLVEQAQTQRAPFVRMADRYAGFFLPATLLVAGARMGDQRRSGPGARGRGRRHAVPADPRRADRARLRTLARGARGRDRQGSRLDRDARRGPHGPVRQDRDADRRHARGARDPCARRAISPAELLRLAASR